MKISTVPFTGLFCFITCALLILSCGRKQELPGDFGDFASKFKTIQTPWSIKNDSVNVDNQALSDTDVKRYLNIDADTVYAEGIVEDVAYVALICRVHWDELETSTLAIFFDRNGTKNGELVLSGLSFEVPEHYAFVEQMNWQGNVIQRKVEYHRGNDDAKSHYAEITTTIEAAGILKNSPDKIVPESNGPATSYPTRKTEIATYLSEDASGIELTGIFPHEDAPVYLIHEKNSVRKLSLNEKEKVPAGMAIDNDNTFGAIEFSDDKESNEGVTFFGTITLHTRTGRKIDFRQAMIKRAPTPIGKEYAYGSHKGDDGFGKILLKEIDPLTFQFSLDVNTGSPNFHICQSAGTMVRKNNIGYYQANQIEGVEDCKLVFVFDSEKLRVFQISGNAACGCGANATVEGDYQLKN